MRFPDGKEPRKDKADGLERDGHSHEVVLPYHCYQPRVVQDPVSPAHATHIMADRQRSHDDESARSSEGFEHRACNVYSM